MPEPYLNSEGEFFSSGISHLLQNIQTFSSAPAFRVLNFQLLLLTKNYLKNFVGA